jgi:hypothetical protein
MKIKLLLDEDVHFALADSLRKRGYDALHVQEMRNKGLSDENQLNVAIRQERCLVSFNMKDFILLHNQCVEDGREHWGIVVSKQRPIGETLRLILNTISGLKCTEMKNRLEFL